MNVEPACQPRELHAQCPFSIGSTYQTATEVICQKRGGGGGGGADAKRGFVST